MWPSLLTIVAVFTACMSDKLESMNTMELLNEFGAHGERHEIITEDGYILEVHRLYSRAGNNKPPVLMQHGMMGVSEAWVLMGPKRDLAFLLWEDGYDVWLGNVRGNTYGLRHVNQTKEDSSFWKFSVHEMGYYDLPAMIDYILRLTKHADLYYIGHSMGTTMSYVLCATRPEYNDKIRTIFSLAPVAYMSHMSDLYKELSKYRHPIYEALVMKEGIHEVFPLATWMRKLLADMCRDGSRLQFLCISYVFWICGQDNIQLNKTILPMVVAHVSSTSANTIMHYAQNLESGEFQWYDHGMSKNLELYGSSKPPNYNLTMVTVPVVLHYSRNDVLSREKDVDRLASLLPNLIGKFLVPFRYFNHIDYMWSKDVKELLYNDIMKIMKRML